MKSKILVFIQFFIIILMLLPLVDKLSYPILGNGLFIFGLSVGIAALYKNRVGKFNIRPDIKEEASLVKDGIYSYIRHPMYLSVLLMMFGVLFLNFSALELFLYFLLVVNLIIKMLYEESLWDIRSEEYHIYKQHTSRLIPYIF